MKWTRVFGEVKGEIMNTDITCEIHCVPSDKERAEKCIREAFEMFRVFASKYSRFEKNNELWTLNHSESTCVSQELFAMLETSKYYYHLTKGIFDPSMLMTMEKHGYTGAYAHNKTLSQASQNGFGDVVLFPDTMMVQKPKNVSVDLGGIGKGFIVDIVADFLSQHFENFIINAGGDLIAEGCNKLDDYPYWAIEVERPDETVSQSSVSIRQNDILLTVSGVAVATSGIRRKKWEQNGVQKHHIMNPHTQDSVVSDAYSVTVISRTTAEADVFAKTIFILGAIQGMKWAKQLHVPTLIVFQDGSYEINEYMTPFLFRETMIY